MINRGLKKIFLVIFICISIKNNTYAQTPTMKDCKGAKPICELYYDEPQTLLGEGNYLNEIKVPYYRQCISEEKNGVWYFFTCHGSGMLRFSITPYDTIEDYDWSVFDMTDATCEELTDNTQKYVISSNTFGSWTINGATGANSTYSYGIAGNCNGPNEDNGPPWNDDIPVEEGRTYMIYISNWMETEKGYRLDFSESSATFFDDTGPVLKEMEMPVICNQNYINAKFSENTECSSFDVATFEIVDDNEKKYTIVSVYSSDCQLGAKYARDVQIQTNDLMPVGKYQLRQIKPVTDACKNAGELDTLYFEIDSLPEPYCYETNIEDCYGDKDGKIYFSYPYSTDNVKWRYSIDNGKTYQYENQFSNLDAGTYQAVVMNLNGCKSDSIEISITQPEKMIFDSLLLSHNQCFNSKNGSAKVFNSGGTKPYFYKFSIQEEFTDFNSLFNLQTQNYTVRIQDANKCLIDSAFAITSPEAITANRYEKQNISCHNFDDGQLLAQATGGTGKLTYILNGILQQDSGHFMNLAAQKYQISINDENNCSLKLDSLTIINPPPLKILTEASYDGCHNRADGKIIVNATGGTGQLLYSIDNSKFQADSKFDSLNLGTYFITIKDENDCQLKSNDVHLISNPPDIFIDTTYQKNITCFAGSDGLIGVQVSGGGGGFTYTIDSFEFNSTGYFTYLTAGEYRVWYRDLNQCLEYYDFVLTQPDSIAVEKIKTDVSCKDDNDGSAFISAYGGTGYFYLKINSDFYTDIYYEKNDYIPYTDVQLDSLRADTLTIFIKDSNQCVLQDTLIIKQLICKPELKIPNVFTPNNDGDNDAFILEAYRVERIDIGIFNRWGRKIYEWNGDFYSWQGWNGHVKTTGEAASEGVYFCYITAHGEDGKKYNYQGIIHLYK